MSQIHVTNNAVTGPLFVSAEWGITQHWSLKAEGCLEKSLNWRLHAKEKSWRGLQFGVCSNNIHWRKHQLRGFYFLQLNCPKYF